MPIVVSDTSPLRALDFLGLLDLPARLFGAVLIPPAVRDELGVPRKRFRAIDAGTIAGAVIRSPTNLRRVVELTSQLQRGEAEAIALAEELKADLLIDEMAGRAVAVRIGLHITGVVGVLVEAKHRGLICEVASLLLRLRKDLGFFLSDKIIEEARRQAGE